MRSGISKIYIALVIAAGAIAFGEGLWTWSSADVAGYLSFSIIALLASGVKIRLPSITGTMSINFVFVLIGISEFSLGETLVMACLGTLVQSFFHTTSRPKPLQIAFNFASVAGSIRVAYAVHHSLMPQNVLLTAVTFFLVNTLSIAVVIALTEGKNVWHVWRDSYFWSLPNYLVGASAAWVVDATRVIGWQPALLVLPILYVVYRSHTLYTARLEEAKTRAEQQRAHAEEVAALHRRTIETLALAIEAKDQTTHDHLERVEIYSVEIGKELGLSETELEALRAAALLHDIGKIAVPEYIISKPGKLTPEEFEKMKRHTIVGAEIAERIRFPYPVAPLVRGHHERWNGTGYPDGLAGENIPMGARILAAVDCLDALSTDRQYHRAMPLEQALSVVQSEAGKSFDPRVVEVLVRRGAELSKMVTGVRIGKLPTDVRVERGDEPAAGFEKSAVDTTGGDLKRLNISIAAAGNLKAAIEKCTNCQDVFQALRSSLRSLVPYDALVVYRRVGDSLTPEFLDGDDYQLYASIAIPLGEGLSGWVAETGKAIRNGNPSVEPGFLKDPSRFCILRSALAVPLIGINGVNGVLSLYAKDEDAFASEHLEAVTSLASALAQVLAFTAA